MATTSSNSETQIRVKVETRQRLDVLKEKTGWSFAEILRRAVNSFDARPPVEKPSRVRRH